MKVLRKKTIHYLPFAERGVPAGYIFQNGVDSNIPNPGDLLTQLPFSRLDFYLPFLPKTFFDQMSAKMKTLKKDV